MDSFIIQDWKIFAPLRIGKQGTYAHLDTGAMGNMLVSSHEADLEAIGERTLSGAMGERQVKQVRIKHLEFLGQTFDDTTAIVFDGEGYFGETPFQVSMTLGATVLLARPLILDFKRLWLDFATTPIREDIARYPMDCSDGLPFIELSVEGRKLQAIFDTGAAYSLFNAAHEAEMKWDLRENYTLEGQDPTGKKSPIPVYAAHDVRIGEIPLGGAEIVKVDLTAIEQRLNRRVDFVLGANTLVGSSLVWVLDKARQSVYVSERLVDVCT